MRKLSEYKDDEAMDLLADIIDPCAEIFADKALVSAIRANKRTEAVKMAVRDHRKDVVEIMARLHGEKVEDFHYNLFTLPMMLLSVLNDKDLLSFFSSQGEKVVETPSGSVTENTEAGEDTSSDI